MHLLTSAGLALLLSACAGGQHPAATHIDITVRQIGDQVVFRFRDARSGESSASIRSIVVERAPTAERAGERVCELRYRGEKPIRGNWTYGTVPFGFWTPKCTPLYPNVPYRIEVAGAGRGQHDFTLEGNEVAPGAGRIGF